MDAAAFETRVIVLFRGVLGEKDRDETVVAAILKAAGEIHKVTELMRLRHD